MSMGGRWLPPDHRELVVFSPDSHANVERNFEGAAFADPVGNEFGLYEELRP